MTDYHYLDEYFYCLPTIGCHKVKFGYVVFTEAETAERLFRQGGVVVRRAPGERIQVQHLATGSVFL